MLSGINVAMLWFKQCYNVHRQLLHRERLDGYLSSALGVPLKDGRLQDIDEAKYVLTLDYTVKVS